MEKNSKKSFKRNIFIVVIVALLTYLLQVDLDKVFIFIKEFLK